MDHSLVRGISALAIGTGRFLAGVLLLAAAAWATHVVACFRRRSWGFLFAGAIVFPVAIVHGVGIWLSVW